MMKMMRYGIPCVRRSAFIAPVRAASAGRRRLDFPYRHSFALAGPAGKGVVGAAIPSLASRHGASPLGPWRLLSGAGQGASAIAERPRP